MNLPTPNFKKQSAANHHNNRTLGEGETTMKRMKIILAIFFVVGGIIAILMYNKSRMQARSQSDILSSIPVTVMTVSKGKIADESFLVGTITANNDVAIISETQGKVTVVVAEVGQYKKAGAVLIQVDDELKQANFIAAESNFEKAKKDLERFETLAKQNAATDQQVEGARLAAKSAEAQFLSARREYHDTKITTPISGIVTARPVDVGTYIQKGMPVANVVDISKLKVKINVAEQDVFRLHVGDKVDVSSDVYPGVTFSAKVLTISDKGDEAHTYPVEVMLENSKSHPLKAGMFARVAFTALTLAQSEVLVIPRGALVGSMKHPQIYIVESGIAKLRTLVIGPETGINLEVLQGVKEGETIVVNGQNNLKDNVPVTIVK
jgi:RND family efflux transporter MFP subunit